MARIFKSIQKNTDKEPMTATMKVALYVSVGLHFGLFALGAVGLPYFSKPPEILNQPIAIEVVDIAELTQTNKKPQLAPPKPKQEEKPPPKQEKKVEAPPKVEATEPPKIKPIEKLPEPKKDTVKPKPKVPPPPKEKLEQPEPEPEKPKKEEPKEEAIQQEDPLLSLMKNLQDSEDGAETDVADDSTPEEAPDAPQAQYVTASELNALANQLISCWQIPIGAKNVNDMVVKVRIWANADRTVKRVEIEDKLRAASDPAFRALAESAKRAVLDPFCSPLDIPEEKYNVWKDQYIVVPFDPSRVT